MEYNLRSIIKELQTDLKAIKKENKWKVESVRNFWKDKIYEEQTRAGVILKKAIAIHNSNQQF